MTTRNVSGASCQDAASSKDDISWNLQCNSCRSWIEDERKDLECFDLAGLCYRCYRKEYRVWVHEYQDERNWGVIE